MNEEKKKNAMELLQKALKKLSKEETTVVKQIMKECQDAKDAGLVDDPQLEFCYCIKMSQDQIQNELLNRACSAYIDAYK
ncbi:hypothetical protein IJT10_04740 [bacterium]|nr:hypothetical protein [bacterium]